MRNSLIILILVITLLCSCGRRSNFRTGNVAKNTNSQQSLIHDLENASGYQYIYTDTTYTSYTGKGITIQNGYPKGGNVEPGTPYTDSTGKKYFFAAFWTRIINGTDAALEFEVNFPADSLPLSSTSDSYLKLFIPTDTMTVDKLPLYSYGLTGIKSFIDTNFNNATKLQKTIKPKGEHIFYIATISYQTGGPARAAIILKEKELFYKIAMGVYESVEIPSGKITLKNNDD